MFINMVGHVSLLWWNTMQFTYEKSMWTWAVAWKSLKVSWIAQSYQQFCIHNFSMRYTLRKHQNNPSKDKFIQSDQPTNQSKQYCICKIATIQINDNANTCNNGVLIDLGGWFPSPESYNLWINNPMSTHGQHRAYKDITHCVLSFLANY